MAWKRTGYDNIPVPGEPYYPSGGDPNAETVEEVRILKENAVTALVKDSQGDLRVVLKKNLRR